MDFSLLKEGAIVVAALAASVLAGIRLAILTEKPRGKIIRIAVDQSGLRPNQFTLVRDEPAVLEIAAAATSFVFFSPGLGIHLTLQPGMPARVQLRPETAGQFVFSCAARDSGLPVLNGTISVID